MKHLRGRLVLTIVAGVAGWILLRLLGDGPRLLPLAGILLVVAGGLGAIYDSLVWHGPTWPAPSSPPPGQGRDRHLAVYERILESNATSDIPDERLRDALRRLVDRRLEQRRGITRIDPEAVDLLGPDLLLLLDAPPRRVSRRELDTYLRRIEAL